METPIPCGAPSERQRDAAKALAQQAACFAAPGEYTKVRYAD